VEILSRAMILKKSLVKMGIIALYTLDKSGTEIKFAAQDENNSQKKNINTDF